MTAREIVTAAVTAATLAMAPHDASAQAAAQLSLPAIGGLVCPAADSVLLMSLVNRSGTSQVIEAAEGGGTSIEFHFPVRVVNARFSGSSTVPIPAAGSVTVSGNIATVLLRQDITVRNNAHAFGLVVTLDLRGVPSGTPVQATVRVDPPSAIDLEGRQDTAVRSLVDANACQPAPVSAFTIDDLTGSCPTAEEVAAFNAALD